MKKKYRLKVSDERIIGPFVLEQIGELYIKGHIDDSQLCQEFPSGDWLPLSDFQEISDLILKIISKKVTLDDLKFRQDSETFHDIALFRKLEKSSKQEVKEFELSQIRKGSVSIDYELLEEKYKNKSSENKENKENKEDKEVKDDGLDKTVINTKLTKMPIEEKKKKKKIAMKSMKR